MKKILNYLINIILILALLVGVGSFCACRKEPDSSAVPPIIEPIPKPTPIPVPNPHPTFTGEKTYKLLNWNLTQEYKCLPTFTVTGNNYSTITFPIPEREGFTFQGWYIGENKVADENGISLITAELLNQDDEYLLAKWTANETFNYKVLIIYITDISGIVSVTSSYQGTELTKINVDHKMTKNELEFCRLATPTVKTVLDNTMDGLVDFQVDEYFTSQPIVIDTHKGIYNSSAISAKNFVPEVADLLDEYDSVFTVYGLVGKNYEILQYDINTYGAASSKYASINLDPLQHYLEENNLTLEEVNNVLKQNNDNLWKIKGVYGSFFETFIHELAHTIEVKCWLEDFHNSIYCYYYNKVDFGSEYRLSESYLIIKMYFLNEIFDDKGSRLGIPYDFWKYGSKTITFEQKTTDGIVGLFGTDVSSFGQIVSRANAGNNLENGRFTVCCVSGSDVTVEVTLPWGGYRFVSWEDGVTESIRTFYNVTEDFTITAIFEKIE